MNREKPHGADGAKIRTKYIHYVDDHYPRSSLVPGIFKPLSGVSSLYIHIPFCAKKCHYCDFFSVPFDDSVIDAYTDALCKEFQLRSGPAGILKTIYVGGGTPTLLDGARLGRIFSSLRENFLISPDAEISVEANPGTLDQSKADLLLSLGVNRMSLGVQSLHDDELKTLGRIHSAEEALLSLQTIEKAGFKNISVDLMYGIPGQSVNAWRETIAMIVEYMPEHISTYELTPEEGTPLYDQIQKIDEDVVLEMYTHAIDYLVDSGYEQYEISNFARLGSRCFHNMNYWGGGEYLGAGAGAHSHVNRTRSINIKNISDYCKRLKNDLTPEIESEKLSSVARLKEFLFLGLRKMEGISIRDAEILGLDVLKAGGDMIRSGYLEIVDDALRFTRAGTVISNAVIVRLLEKLRL